MPVFGSFGPRVDSDSPHLPKPWFWPRHVLEVLWHTETDKELNGMVQRELASWYHL
ncbi:hypothetical protein BDR04DRAFT_1101518 [Suillus decipiens]|nr:hypothetical protein BDR04DRAFT_1101518 [Suillus decipiens]